MKKIDILIILICLAASVLSGSAFWNEYTRTLTKLNEEPIGTITFKRRTAQRKFIDRFVWDILKQESDVYNGDTIRTIEASEAVILFKDNETQITMNANTLIQIFYNEKDGARIDFSGGNLEVNSEASGGTQGNRVVVISGSSEVVVAGRANLVNREEGFSLSVMEGEAELNGEKIEDGEILIINDEGIVETVPAISVTSIKTSEKIFAIPGQPVPIVFSWNTFNFSCDDFVIIDIARDPSFNRIIQSMEVKENTTVTLFLEESSIENRLYFWRAYPAKTNFNEPLNTMYPSGLLEIDSVREIVQTSVVQEPENVTDTETVTTEVSIVSAEPQRPQTSRTLTPEERARPFIDRGIRFRNAGDLDSAIREFTEAIIIIPNNAEYFNLRGQAYLENKDLDRAMTDFTECIRLNPNIADAHIGSGNVSLVKGHLARAIESAENALRLQPNNTRARELLETANRWMSEQ